MGCGASQYDQLIKNGQNKSNHYADDCLNHIRSTETLYDNTYKMSDNKIKRIAKRKLAGLGGSSLGYISKDHFLHPNNWSITESNKKKLAQKPGPYQIKKNKKKFVKKPRFVKKSCYIGYTH